MSSIPSRSGPLNQPVAKMLESVTVDRDCLPAGSAVGSFVLHEVLERDDFGVFYRAGSSASDSIVVIEEYWPQALAQRSAEGDLVVRSDKAAQQSFAAGLAAFVEETGLLGQPSHPALVTLGPVWRLRNTAYRLRIEQAGEMLTKHLDHRERPPDERWLRALAERLLGALACVHDLGRTHGNVRPGNILIRADGQCLLLEFGAARAAVAHDAPWLAAPIEPDFSAPERHLYAAAALPAADLYSLAAVLVFCMFGEVPAPVPSAQRRMGKGRLASLLDELQRRHPALRYSDTWIDTLERALSFEADARPQTVDAFRRDLARPPGLSAPPVAVPPSFRAPGLGHASPGRVPPGPFNGPTLTATADDLREPTWHAPAALAGTSSDVLLHVPLDHDPSPTWSVAASHDAAGSAPAPLDSPLMPTFGRLEADPSPPHRAPIIRKSRRWPWAVAGAVFGAGAMLAFALGMGQLAEDARLAKVLGTAPSALGDLLPSIRPAGNSPPVPADAVAGMSGGHDATPAAQAPSGNPVAGGSAGAAPTLATAPSPAGGGGRTPSAAAAVTGVVAAGTASASRAGSVVTEVKPREPAAAVGARAATEGQSRPPAARNQVATVASADPASACAPRSNFSLYLCMKRQCEQAQLYAHPQCVQLRRDDAP